MYRDGDERSQKLQTFGIVRDIDRDAGITQPRDPASGDARVGILAANDDAGQFGRDQRRHAGRGFFVGMAAGFQRDIRRRARRRFRAGGQRLRLGMGAAKALVPALAEDAVVVGDNAANHRIGFNRAAAFHRQADGLTQEIAIHWREG